MAVQRIKRVANLVRHAGGEQGERVYALGLERLLRRAPALGDVAQNHRVTNLLACSRARRSRRSRDIVPGYRIAVLDHQRHDVEINKPVRWIENFHVAADWPSALRQ